MSYGPDSDGMQDAIDDERIEAADALIRPAPPQTASFSSRERKTMFKNGVQRVLDHSPLDTLAYPMLTETASEIRARLGADRDMARPAHLAFKRVGPKTPVGEFRKLAAEVLYDRKADPVVLFTRRYEDGDPWLDGEIYYVDLVLARKDDGLDDGYEHRHLSYLLTRWEVEQIESQVLDEVWADGGIYGVFNGLSRISPDMERIANFIREEVVPEEWRQWSAGELGERIAFRKGLR